MSRGLESQNGFSANDRALIDEAVRRVQASRSTRELDQSAILQAVSTAVLQGRRDLFGLVKAGSRVGQDQ